MQDARRAARARRRGRRPTKPVLAPTRVDEPPILAPDVDDQGLARRQRRVDLQRRAVDPVRYAASRSRTGRRCRRRPGRRSPPGRPSRARSTAVLAAPPPMFKTSSSTVTSSPGRGQVIEIGGQRWSATTSPAQTTGRRRGVRGRGRHELQAPGRWMSGRTVEPIYPRDVRACEQLLAATERRHDGLSIDATTSFCRRTRRGSSSSITRLPISSSISATVRTSRSIRASVSAFELVAMFFEQAVGPFVGLAEDPRDLLVDRSARCARSGRGARPSRGRGTGVPRRRGRRPGRRARSCPTG